MKSTRASLPFVAAALVLAPAVGCSSPSGDEAVDASDPDAGTGSGADAGTDADGQPPTPAGVVAAGVRWFGRVDIADPAGPRFAWSGTGFIARFSGTALTAQLAVAGASEIFKTVVDGAPQATFIAGIGQGTYPLASALSADVHTVELYRQTEGPQGQTQLLALTVTGGALMDPPAGPGRLIEVIGDSITCGYGDLGTAADLTATGDRCLSTESHWDAYESVAARALGAEVSTIAASGRGVVRNYGDVATNTTGTMPVLYARTLTNLAAPLWDFHIQPQAVVINLGTNDISMGDPGVAFRDAYVALLETVRSNYPDALIVSIIGPLLSGGNLAVIQGYIKAAVDTRNAAGDAKVEFFNQIATQTSDKFACQYHPNVAEQMLMADQLAGELKARLGW